MVCRTTAYIHEYYMVRAAKESSLGLVLFLVLLAFVRQHEDVKVHRLYPVIRCDLGVNDRAGTTVCFHTIRNLETMHD